MHQQSIASFTNEPQLCLPHHYHDITTPSQPPFSIQSSSAHMCRAQISILPYLDHAATATIIIILGRRPSWPKAKEDDVLDLDTSSSS